jgi:tripartite-type tricarboxylate transporter receptor subunit TctC
LRDFAPITLLAIVKQVLVVPSSGDIRSVADLITHARARAGRMNYGSSSIGGAPHLAMELFKQVAGVDIVHIPFNGAAPAMTALLGGSVDVMFAAVPTATDMVRTGRIRALGMASASRSGMLPDVPTMSEAGLPGVEMDSWFGLLAPAGTARELLTRLNIDTVRAVDGEETRDSFARLGFERATGTAEALTALMKNERERVGRVVRQAGIKGE